MKNAYSKPKVETLQADQVVEAMGPAQGYGSNGTGTDLTVYPAPSFGDPYHFAKK